MELIEMPPRSGYHYGHSKIYYSNELIRLNAFRKYSTQVYPANPHEGRNQAGGAGVVQSGASWHSLQVY
jgi:hypothetical protein